MLGAVAKLSDGDHQCSDFSWEGTAGSGEPIDPLPDVLSYRVLLFVQGIYDGLDPIF
jgi:hypothetical protein